MRGAAEVELPEYLPLSTRLERTFAARVADLPLNTRIALLVAALTDRADVTEVLAAAARVCGEPLGLDAFTPAVAAGLVEVDEQQVRFGHPLMRSAIAQGGPETQRRAAHAALAETLAGDPARAVWHRVAASFGPDDALADELSAVAQRAVRRGAIVTAAETLGRAAALTGDEAARGGAAAGCRRARAGHRPRRSRRAAADRRGAAGARGRRPAAAVLAAAHRAPPRARPRRGSRPTWTGSMSSRTRAARRRRC